MARVPAASLVDAASRRRGRAWLVCALVLCAAAAGCNAWRGLFPSHRHESEPPAVPALASEPAILVFTKTNGYRHGSIPDGVAALRAIAERRGWALFHTENGAVHEPALLARFDAVVWLQTSGDVLDEAQRAALRGWIEAGGGFVGVHGAGGDRSYAWRWYVEELIGAHFIGHIMSPQLQHARVVVEDREHPATRRLPPSFLHREEWYSFAASPRARGARILLSVDESSYDPSGLFGSDLAMEGGDHPVAWSHCPGSGRALYSALGHPADAWAVPEHLALLEGAVAWAAGLEDTRCSHALRPATGG